MEEKIKKSCSKLEQALVLHTEVKFALASVGHSGALDADKLRAKTKIFIHKLRGTNDKKRVRTLPSGSRPQP